MVKELSNEEKSTLLDDRLRKEVNRERLNILDDFRATPEEIQEEHDRAVKDREVFKNLLTQIDHDDNRVVSRGFKKRWWKFDREADGKIPLMGRWAYTRLSGTGQLISLGITFSVGPSWGAFVINVPMVELTVGYVPSPMSL